MKIHRLKIEGFRRIVSAEIYFGDATFLIGPNNAGKSSIFSALDVLLKAGKSSLSQDDFHKCLDEEGKECVPGDTVVLEAEFRNLPDEAKTWQGFRGRVLRYDIPEGSAESGLSIVYRKTFNVTGETAYEMLTYPAKLREPYASAKTIQELIEGGMPSEHARAVFSAEEGKINKPQKIQLDEYDPAWDVDETKPEWISNPGGFPSIVTSRLPTFIPIPLDDGRGQITDKSGALELIMKELFNEVRDASENYKQAQVFLDLLAKELDPKDGETPLGKLMDQLNGVLGSVFDQAQFHASADLSKPDDSIKPTFTYKMSSNVQTPVPLQGSGMIRSAVFALLKFRQQWLKERGIEAKHGLIIGFEEPEIYLHPNAADQMRSKIYELSSGDVQMICTTHSPYMVDLSRQERQVLNSMRVEGTGISSSAFSLTAKFQSLHADDQPYVKMLQCMDDHAARVFFADYVVVVEGDTEDIVLRETIKRMPEGVRKAVLCGAHIFKARGKGAIISLVKYLHAFGIKPFVIHDGDHGTPGAEKFNEPIAAVVGDPERILVMSNCVEDELGYASPSNDKPYKAYKHIGDWGAAWGDVPENWRGKMELVFKKYFEAREGV